MKRLCVPAILVASTLQLAGCLPADTRPEPAKVLINVDLPEDLRTAQTQPTVITFQTDDGWTIELNRLFVTMGEAMLVGSHCNNYEGVWYRRILDLSQPGPQKLEQIYGLNDCQLQYSVGVPDKDTVLGQGVTEQDRDFMVNALVPVAAPQGLGTAIGMAAQIQGFASKDAVSVSFDWGFSDHFTWENCRLMVDATTERKLPLTGGDTTTVEIGVDPRNLFRASTTTENRIAKFSLDTPIQLGQLIADSDQVTGDANGRVALDELQRVPFNSGSTRSNVALVMRMLTFPSMFVYGNNVGSRCSVGFGSDDE